MSPLKGTKLIGDPEKLVFGESFYAAGEGLNTYCRGLDQVSIGGEEKRVPEQVTK